MVWVALQWLQRSSGSNMDENLIHEGLNSIREALSAQAVQLGKIEQYQEDTKSRLFGGDGQLGAIPFLQGEIKEAQTVLSDHTSKFTFYRGVAAVVTFMWTAGVSVALALIGHHHK
jgi:hypothetical protein